MAQSKTKRGLTIAFILIVAGIVLYGIVDMFLSGWISRNPLMSIVVLPCLGFVLYMFYKSFRSYISKGGKQLK